MMANNNIIKTIFDKLTEVIESANESVWSFAAVILPYISPVTTAILTTASLQARLELDNRIAWLFAGVLELVGVLATSFFVHAFLGYIKSRNPKVKGMLWFLGLLNFGYVLVLLSINALLSYLNQEDLGNTFVISLLCLIPVMGSALYGYYKLIVENKHERQEEKQTAFQIRQEQREDKLKRAALKQGMNIFAADTVALNATSQPEAKVKHGSDFKDKAWEMLDEQYSKDGTILSPAQITERINKKYRANLEHAKVKGFWTRTTKEWRVTKGI